MKKYLNKKETLLELIECVKTPNKKYICNHARMLLRIDIITQNMCRWVISQMNPKNVPIEFHTKSWTGSRHNGLWKYNEEEMRVKYLEYLIEQL